jgi:histidinol-phosphatase
MNQSGDGPPVERMLALAERAALETAPLIMSGYRQTDLAVEKKSDGSPVTRFDREAERQIRQILQSDSEWRFPVLGEEFGADPEAGRFRWVVDPIDGTMPFTRGLPWFGTLIALEDTETARSLVGVINVPACNELYSAARGLGARCNSQPLRMQARRSLRDSLISTPDVRRMAAAGWQREYVDLCARAHMRGLSDCWGHAMVARGAIDVLIEPNLQRWDVAATQIVVEEAGGRCLLRDSSTTRGKFDLLCGAAHLVEEIAELLSFRPA